jgi:hypothetical protein
MPRFITDQREKRPAVFQQSVSRSPWRRGVLLVALTFVLAWLALSPAARAVIPAPDGGYPGGNTAEGEDALFDLTTGVDNTALGNHALWNNTTGNNNTANGSAALLNNTTGNDNTANGSGALFDNIGSFNTATGRRALTYNTTGNNNTATGVNALLRNTKGTYNSAEGAQALYYNTTGSFNTADGASALLLNTTGNYNTAIGRYALYSNKGSYNIGLGLSAGADLTTGSNNIDIGHRGVAAEANTIRIGVQGTQVATYVAGIRGTTAAGGVAVFVDANGRLGTATSSRRFKEQIKPMDQASEAILSLRPVSFRYKHELDSEGMAQFGLVAEEVEKINPALVARDEKGEAYTVRYEAVNAMLLNEFLKEHRKVQELEAMAAQQQKEIRALAATLKEQASLIQKVSQRLQLSESAPRVVAINQ